MRANKLIAAALSLVLCAGTLPALDASPAKGAEAGAVPAATSEKTAAANDAAIPDTETVVNAPSVITIKLGDVNGDSFIDATDASAILAEYALLSGGKSSGFTAAQTLAADVNKDGLVDAVDASDVLSYYAYLSTSGSLSLENYLAHEQAARTTTTTTSSSSSSSTTSTTTATTTAAATTTSAVPTTTKVMPATSAITAVYHATTTTASTSATSRAVSTVTSTAPVTLSSTAPAAGTTTAAVTAAPTTSTTTAAPTTTTTTAAQATTTATAVTTTTIPPVTTTSAVSDPNRVQRIQLTDSDFTITVGGRALSFVTMFPVSAQDKSATWESSEPNIATVDAIGNITGISEGECTVTVKSKANPEVYADIKVKVIDSTRVREIILSKYTMELNVDQKDIAYVTMNPSTALDKNEIWTSSDESVASVDKWGNVCGISEGECTITVYSRSNPAVKADISVAVKDPNKVSGIKLSTDELTIPIDKKGISYVTMLPANASDKEEIWVCSDSRIAKVDQNGWITGVSEGYCAVTVYSKANPNVYASIKVHITDPGKVREIKLSSTELEIEPGKRGISYVTMLPETAADVTEIWSSSNPDIASVDEWGNILGVSEGTCKITVQSASNPEVTAEIKVTVKNRTTTSSATTTTTATTVTSSVTTSTTAAAPQHLVQVQNGVTYIDGILVVNKSYKLPESYDAKGLNPIVADSFRRLSTEAASKGLSIVCTSGYRSYADQERIYNNYVAVNGAEITDTFSARPGHSEHQTGLAIDVNSISDAFEGTPECRWLAENAHRFGFIIRYPKGMENITGFRYEPWHIRYVGAAAAEAIYTSGLCLEEYLGIDSYYH